MESSGLDAASGTSEGLRTQQAPVVLVVEDDDAVAGAIGSCLSHSGYRTIRVRDGAEALAQMSGQRVEMVLLDWRLPGEPAGTRLIHKLRAACSYRLPVVVISGDPLALTEASKAGVEDYLPKPFNLEDLIHVVDEYCR